MESTSASESVVKAGMPAVGMPERTRLWTACAEVARGFCMSTILGPSWPPWPSSPWQAAQWETKDCLAAGVWAFTGAMTLAKRREAKRIRDFGGMGDFILWIVAPGAMWQ